MSVKRLLTACLGMLLLGAAGLILLHQTVDAPPRTLAQPEAGPPGLAPAGDPDEGPPGTPGRYRDLVPALLGALADSDAGVRQLAAATLVRVGPDAVPPLVEALGGKDRETRANAAYVLGHLGEAAHEALPALAKALKDEDREVRRRAAYALHTIVTRSEAALETGGFPGEAGVGPASSPGMRGAPGWSGTPGPWDPGLLLPPVPPPGKPAEDKN